MEDCDSMAYILFAMSFRVRIYIIILLHCGDGLLRGNRIGGRALFVNELPPSEDE